MYTDSKDGHCKNTPPPPQVGYTPTYHKQGGAGSSNLIYHIHYFPIVFVQGTVFEGGQAHILGTP